jgi:pyrroloquinoline quinone biosynthesis protein B
MGRLTALVLGSAAGGGFPQWNCRYPTCRLAWAGDARVRPRTQASLAATADGENLAPDQRVPRPPSAGSAIEGAASAQAEIDQVAGLLSLREREPFMVCVTPVTLAALVDNAMFAVLAPDVVRRRAIIPGVPLMLPGEVQVQLFIMPGKLPLYLEGENAEIASETAANVGVEISAHNARMVYIPGAAAVTAAMTQRIRNADVVFFEGTLFRDDEMITSGTGAKTGRRMGHMPINGQDGSLAALEGLAGRRIYVHINNTNPILIDGSPERVHERVFKAAPIAAEIIKRCTGEVTFGEFVDDLAKTYAAPREKILADVGTLLRGLADKKLLEV